MTLDENLIGYLTTNATQANGQVATEEITLDTPMPALVVSRENGYTPQDLSGRKLFSRASFVVGAIGLTPTQAQALANQVRPLLDRFRGTMGAVDGTRVESCRCVTEPIPSTFRDGELARFRYDQTFRFLFVGD